MAGSPDEGDGCQFSLTETVEEATQHSEALETELKRNLEILCGLKAEFLKVDKSRQVMQLQLNAKEREIQSISEEMILQQMQAIDLEAGVQAIYQENINLKQKIEENAVNFQLKLAEYDMYRNKMENHKLAVFKQESQTMLHRALMEKGQLINRLKEERAKLKVDLENPEGNTMKQAQKEVDELKVHVSAMKELVFNKTELLLKEQENHTELRKDIEIQNRRCEAILRRLRCQLNKAQSNHRQLTDDIRWLEREAADLRRRLVEIQERSQVEF